MKEPTQFPAELPLKNFTATIYRRSYQKKGKGYTEFKFAFYDADNKRQFRTSPTWEGIEAKAREVANTIRSGDSEALSMTGEDRRIYIRATSAVKPFGVPLDIVALQWASLRALVGDISPEEVGKFWRDRHVTNCDKTAQDAVDDFIAKIEKRDRKPSPRYLEDLRSRLDKFAGSFPNMRLDQITPAQLESFLDRYSGRTRFNYSRVIKSLFKYAQSRKWVPKDFDAFENIDTDYEDDGEVEIFSPAELSKLLTAARPEMVPFLAIGAFAGLRHAEIKRLDWSDIQAEHIVVAAKKAKTRSRRLVPIQPNLSKWLAPHRKASGPLVGFSCIGTQIVALAKAAGVKWRHNGMRHSFISYRLSAVHDENRVASEAGNSPAMIFKHYRALATEKEAALWWAIEPSPAA